MTIVYPITNTKDPHWQALSHSCRHLADDDEDVQLSEFITGLALTLDKINGSLVIDENVGVMKWIDSLEFDTEEDLVIFKLTFN